AAGGGESNPMMEGRIVPERAEKIPAPQVDSAREILAALPDPHRDALAYHDAVDKAVDERDFDSEEEAVLITLNELARSTGNRRLPYDSFEELAQDTGLSPAQITRVKSRLGKV